MNNWKKDLDKKETELNLKKEEINEIKSRIENRSVNNRGDNSNSIGCSSNENACSTDSIRSISDRSNNVFCGRILSQTRQVNNVKEKEEKVMITKEAALDDLEKVVVDAPVGKVIVEVAKILVKMLATIRSNQLLTDEEKVKIQAAKKAREAKKVPQS